jgi:hypothetical protein
MASTQQPWDPGGFWEAVDEIRKHAAELYYIDKAVKYVETWVNYPSTAEAYTPAVRFDVEIGWTAPFTVTVERLEFQVDEGYFSQLQSTLQGFADTGASWATGELSGVGSGIVHLTTPDGDSLTSAAQNISEGVQDTLVTAVSGELAPGLQKTIGEWWGLAAEGFYNNFVTPWDGSRENQAYLANGIAVCAAAAGAIVRQSQHSLMNAVCTIRDTLKEQIELRQSQHDGGLTVSEVLMLAGAATSLLGVFKLPADIATTVTVSGVMIGFASSGVESGETKSLPSQTAEEMVADLHEVIGDIVSRTETHWDGLLDKVSEVHGKVDAMPKDKPLYPPRPDLADGAKPSDFYHSSSPLYDS